ncbi:MAG: T9SS type A sorting domain-containing protein [bacterium]
MKKNYLFLLAVLLMFGFNFQTFAQFSDLGLPPKLEKLQAEKLTISAVQSYQITNKSSELQIEVFVDNPGLSFSSLSFTVTNPVGVFFYGASTFDDAYHWTYINHEDSLRFRTSPTDYFKVKKRFLFRTDGRVVGPDSGFVLKLHFKIDQPSQWPAGDTLLVTLSALAAFNQDAKVGIQPLYIDIKVPFGEKIEDPDPEPKDSVGFKVTQLYPINPGSDEVVMRLNVLNPDLDVNKFEYLFQLPKGMSYKSVNFSSEPDGYTYDGEVLLNDSSRNSYYVAIWSPADSLYFRNSQNCYVDLHCSINKPTSYQAGDSVSFLYYAVYAWQSSKDTVIRFPIKGLDPRLFNLALRHWVIFEESPDPEPKDSVSFTIKQLEPINTDSDELNLRITMNNPGYEINKFEFMLRFPESFSPLDITTSPDDPVEAEYMYNSVNANGIVYYFHMYTVDNESLFDDQVYMDVKLKINKPNSYQTGDTANFIVFVVGAYYMAMDTLIDYPIKGYQEELYNLAYKLPVIFNQGSVEPGESDLFFEDWVDDSRHFMPRKNELTVFLKRSDLENIYTDLMFNILIESKYQNIEEIKVDELWIAENVELETSQNGEPWAETEFLWEFIDNGNFFGTVSIKALGMLPNKPEENPADFLKFTIKYRDIYSEELTLTLDNIHAQTADNGMIGKTEKINGFLDLDLTETITVNLVEPFRKLLADPNDVNNDGKFDVRDVVMALDMAEWKTFGNLKARIAADAAEPFNREIDYEDYLELLKRLSTTSVDDYDPINLRNYPNPVNEITTIYFSLPFNSEVSLELYDLLGQKVKPLTSGYYNTGNHSLQLDCSDLPAGTYTYVLKFGNVQKVQRLLVR